MAHTKLGFWAGPRRESCSTSSPCLTPILQLSSSFHSTSALSSPVPISSPPAPAVYLGKDHGSVLLWPWLPLNLWRAVCPSPSPQASDCASTCCLQLWCFLSFITTTAANVRWCFSNTLLLSCLRVCNLFVTKYSRLPLNHWEGIYTCMFASEPGVLNSPTYDFSIFFFWEQEIYKGGIII